MTDARIREIAPGVIAERIAKDTHIDYDPDTGAMAITFVAPEFLVVGDDVQPMMSTPAVLRFDLGDIATRTFGADEVDPVTGADLGEVSAAGVALIIKRAFDVLYNEHAAAQPEG